MTTTATVYGTPVAPAVPARTLELLNNAAAELLQAVYEGSHHARQEPAPTHGSPWDTANLPADVQHALELAVSAVNAARILCLQHR